MAIKLNITYEELTSAAERRLTAYQAQAVANPSDALFCRGWAFGVMSLWTQLTAGCYSPEKDADYKRLFALSKCDHPNEEQ